MNATSRGDLVYAGFWIRLWAAIVDSLLLALIVVPLAWSIYGEEYFLSEAVVTGLPDFVISYVLPAVIVIAFWIYKQATPGKMAVSATIVDARTGGRPSVGQLIGRYLAYFVSGIPLGLGFIWVAFDGRKQGWHDKLAGTVVVRSKSGGVESVAFENGAR